MIPQFFNCGSLYPRPDQDRVNFVVQDIAVMLIVMIPFFTAYPIINIKHLDYDNFVAAITLFKEHGRACTDQIRKLRTVHNFARLFKPYKKS